MNMENKPTVEEIYASGKLSIAELQRIKSKFNISCAFCGNQKVEILTESNSSYCETCGPDPAEAIFKCPKCGNGITIKI